MVRPILKDLKDGKISIEEAEKLIKSQFLDIREVARFDIGRKLRTGFPEAILALGKDDDDIVQILLSSPTDPMIVTRLSPERFENIREEISSLEERGFSIKYNKRAHILVVKRDDKISLDSKVGIITAGTADIPVAEEARTILEEYGCQVIRAYDVGVAGIHRLVQPLYDMLEDDVKIIIVVAGMEGALPSVVAGLVDVPVIGVPTSIGYGVGEGGFSALYSMLQSCTPGIGVVNIDNGFGAAALAIKIIRAFE
ncbi:nickel pincer cofactor biosynthesis protein LarB [Methanothermobacter tenebrarum]|uniref:Nickel pincer cofactor biosynthesis protein LarB n=1 Tax=Methanothermobacter tenebrarum TaxID=680118 RepID=A0A328PBE7_9EURY|nr:nickel pincer cofactor biosynthesis protein LarB [Methanothermobacter tenebrarum]MBC7100600.1 nickel pincer cofactor biosynthesis protein LarB [Methanobacteriales archaeon]MBC7118204.1 nickel pincer cofactor biosynthesis protein LarB [Methanobacteriaceae archaeon]NPV65283.1 nickel pincer cofactor biosynthesis protein LarB [Methanobacteriaceae archaeon]RAO79709.1 nickel pincer cofactor biosynthesis protein LarB [Methanothermobacter tenebrarum]